MTSHHPVPPLSHSVELARRDDDRRRGLPPATEYHARDGGANDWTVIPFVHTFPADDPARTQVDPNLELTWRVRIGLIHHTTSNCRSRAVDRADVRALPRDRRRAAAARPRAAHRALLAARPAHAALGAHRLGGVSRWRGA
jgi:hypothetical protein